MKIVIGVLLLLQCLLHLLVFLVGSQLGGGELLTIEINRGATGFWLVTGILFGITLILFLVAHPKWPVWAFVAVLLSQILIILIWKVAWAGTILNGPILLLSIIHFGQNEFRLLLRSELASMSASLDTDDSETISETDLTDLPLPVRKWLLRTGIVGREPIRKVQLTQRLKMKMKLDQETWSTGRATQSIFYEPPGFHWSVEVKMNALVGFLGRDKWEDGAGFMSIRLLGLIPVVQEANNPQINEAALQRYLAEIVWCPSFALSPHIKWFPINERCARAVLTHRGTLGEGVFHFDELGDFQFFSALRYQDVNQEAERIPWRVVCEATEVRAGIRIPTRCRASWEMAGERWTWLQLEVEEYTPK